MSKLIDIIKENRKKAREEARPEAKVKSVLRVMEEFGCSEEKAMRLLRVPKDEWEPVRALVNVHKSES